MIHTQAKLSLERNLSLVLGRQIDLRSPEIRAITTSDLKHAYYHRAHEFHPDKAASLGLDPEFLAGKFRSLQDSYSFLLESWNSGLFTMLIGEPEPGRFRPKPATRPDPARSQPQTPRDRRPERPERTERHAASAWRRPPESSPSGNSPILMYQGKDIPQYQLRFAQYLYYSRRIDWQTLIRALSWQLHVRPRLGDLGTELGYMGRGEVLTVIRQKKISDLFGETAVRLGVISPYELSVLIGRQRLLNMPIGKFFVENGYLDDEDLALSLASLNDHNYRIRTTSVAR